MVVIYRIGFWLSLKVRFIDDERQWPYFNVFKKITLPFNPEEMIFLWFPCEAAFDWEQSCFHVSKMCFHVSTRKLRNYYNFRLDVTLVLLGLLIWLFDLLMWLLSSSFEYFDWQKLVDWSRTFPESIENMRLYKKVQISRKYK